MFEDHLVRDINAGRFGQGCTLVLVTHGLAARIFLQRCAPCPLCRGSGPQRRGGGSGRELPSSNGAGLLEPMPRAAPSHALYRSAAVPAGPPTRAPSQVVPLDRGRLSGGL